MQIAFLIIFGALWSAGALFFDGLMAQDFFHQWQSRQFFVAEGVMTHSEIKSYHKSKGGIGYEAIISYEFKVDGRTYVGERWRNGENNSWITAQMLAFAKKHPKGSAVQVYYNPSNPTDCLLSPGVKGVDFFFLLFLAPFNAVMFGFWAGVGGWLRRLILRPPAGGLKVIKDAITTRVQMPDASPIAVALATIGVLGFILIFVVGFATNMNPSIALILPIIALVYLSGAAMFVRHWLKIQSGQFDLVINHGSRVVELPPTCGRKQRMTIPFANIDSVWAEKRTHYSRSGSSFSYAVSFSLRHADPLEQKLVDWSDRTRAENFNAWLSNELGLPTNTRTT